ncbi:hypothetical protein GEMRC1_007397 [Eukaryota sp. GEM-RC1]
MIGPILVLPSIPIAYLFFVGYAFVYSFSISFISGFDTDFVKLLLSGLITCVALPSLSLLVRSIFVTRVLRRSRVVAMFWILLSLYPLTYHLLFLRLCPDCFAVRSSSLTEILNIALFPAVCEEVFFNGFLAQYLEQYWSNHITIVMTSLLISLAHVDTIQKGPLSSNLSAFLAIASFSSSQTAFALKTNHIIPAIINHFAVNLSSLTVSIEKTMC